MWTHLLRGHLLTHHSVTLMCDSKIEEARRTRRRFIFLSFEIHTIIVGYEKPAIFGIISHVTGCAGPHGLGFRSLWPGLDGG